MKDVPFEVYEIPAGTSRSGKAYEAFTVIETAIAVPLEFPAKELGVPVSAVRQRFTQFGCSYTAFKRTPAKTGIFKVE